MKMLKKPKKKIDYPEWCRKCGKDILKSDAEDHGGLCKDCWKEYSYGENDYEYDNL